jgi:D-3-phosphoglycerate dehydrogenase
MVEPSSSPAPNNGNGNRVIKYRRLRPFKTAEIKVLLLENISKAATNMLKEAGYQVEVCAKSMSKEELGEKLKTVHALGIRSKTQITEELIKEAPCLLTIGCFCIGTNQVNLEAALSRGIAVFNSPFSNSRSVAELVLAEIIGLSRQLGERNNEMHAGRWNKTALGCREIRRKVLGIVGYGHIGSQLSVLAESMGMRVLFHDIQQLMPLGMAMPVGNLEELLRQSDFISLHVPETPETVNMIGAHELRLMKKGACLINASRGTVVDLVALKESLTTGHLGGAALDVFPEEPEANGAWNTGLEGLPNVILTPHIGGSTEEAQAAIGVEVATSITRFLDQGTTLGSANFPELDLRVNTFEQPSSSYPCRVLNVHHNVPGVLLKINKILGEFNIEKQVCESRGQYSYVMADVNANCEKDLEHIFESVFALPEAVATRIVYLGEN